MTQMGALSTLQSSSRWQMRKQQSSALSPWVREWARERAQGRAQDMAQARAGAHRIPQEALAAAGGPLLPGTASTRTSRPVWTTSESPEA